MKLKETILCLFCCLIFSAQYGQPTFTAQYSQSNNYVFSHLDFANGLSNNHVTSIYKDAEGFMWFGTMSGLNRYDGYQFKVYKHDSKDPGSISDNYIEQIFEGPNGQLWAETRAGGFNIYDVEHDRFDQDFGAYLRKLSLPEYKLLNIARAGGSFWFVYENKGLFHYLSNGSKIITVGHVENDPGSIDSSKIASAKADGDGNLWVLHQNGLIEEIDGRKNKVIYRTDLLKKDLGDQSLPCSLFIDGQNDLWICSNGVFKGAYFYHPPTHELQHLSTDAGKGRINNNIVYSIIQDSKGLIWLATDHGGINIVDKKDLSVKIVEHIEDDSRSLSDNSIRTIYKDSSGTIWIGAIKNGICYYHQNLIRFPGYSHQPLNPASLNYDDINSLVEDARGNIWIGANGGGLIYFDRVKNSFHQFLHNPGNNNSLCNNIIVSMLLDKENKLWIGTYFGGLDCYDGKTFTHYRHNDKIPGSLAEDRVMCVYEDTDHAIWVGTLAAGLEKLDKKKNIFYHYNSSQPDGLRNNYVSAVTEDAQKNLWIATGFGIDVRERSTGHFIHYSNKDNQLSSDNVISLLKDSRQQIWAGTREGLDLFIPGKNSFRSFRKENGLCDNTIRSILEDQHHNIWVSTSNGLSNLIENPSDHSVIHYNIKNYHEQDGLQGREFNEKAGLITRDGTILFAGAGGFNIFRPENITSNETTPPIVLTGLEIFNKRVRVGEKTGGRVILDKTLTETSQITLPYSDNVFSLEFASMDFIYNAENKYAYKLEGFNTNWLITDGKVRKATYTNLNAGEYIFKVKTSDENGKWYDKEASLKIIILPPLWKTPFAYFIYALITVALLYFARRMIIERARMRFAMEQERREARRMHEMDLMKIRFFTNMSHELRTPLSLILAPVEKLLHHPALTDPKSQYKVILRNAKRLLHLVNQLLDFRKMEVNELKLNARTGDVLKFVREISYSFIDLAERKSISFSYYCVTDSLITLFDHDKLERILFNLLSNAFKFTPENGAVGVEVYVEKGIANDVTLCIKVKDNGIGIPAERQERIFERFFQSEIPNTILNQGSGIGLAITQEFVKMHNGHISVSSAPDKGSCFTISLPFKTINGTNSESFGSDHLIQAEEALPEIAADEQHIPILQAETPVIPYQDPSKSSGNQPKSSVNHVETAFDAKGVKKSTILIVEDNEDFRFYLKDNLRPYYTIIEATDGREGWRKALAIQPDLIVSDISMPNMNGIELCEKIRKDERTCKMPVILLTAMAGEAGELESLKTGATDYIVKPFNFEVLLSKLRNVLENNEMIKRTWQRQVQVNPANLEIASADDIFLQQVLEMIEKNMENPDFSVAELSIQFHASRSTFYKRVLLLTGKTPIEFIRQIRLKRAAELLTKSQMTVSEIAYTVGFNSPKYFTQYFKMEFGIIPSAYRVQNKSQVNKA